MVPDNDKALLLAMDSYAPKEGDLFYMRAKDGKIGVFSYWPDDLRWVHIAADRYTVRSYYAREFSEVLGKVPSWEQWEEKSGKLQREEPRLNLLSFFPKEQPIDAESEVPETLGKFLSTDYPRWVRDSRSVSLLVGDQYGSGSIEVKLTYETPRSAIGTLELTLPVREGDKIEPLGFTIYFTKE